MTLGIDIGGTTINLGLVEGTRVIRKVQVPSFPPTAMLEETLLYLGDRIADIQVPGITRMGIGVPSIVDPAQGIVYDAANIPSWTVVPLKEVLERRFGIPVSVNNDANCYALGAALKLGGAAATVVTVTLGTGIGTGIVIDGKLFSGTHCGAGEICSIPYNGADYESFCSKKFFTMNGTVPKDTALAAERGEEKGLALFRSFGEHLGRFLSVVMFSYDADCIVLGGGISHSFPLFRTSMWDSLRSSYPYQCSLDSLDIIPMPEEDTALIGASSL